MRDYKREYEVEKKSKISKLIKIKREDWEILENKLDMEKRSFSEFVQDQIKKYIKN